MEMFSTYFIILLLSLVMKIIYSLDRLGPIYLLENENLRVVNKEE